MSPPHSEKIVDATVSLQQGFQLLNLGIFKSCRNTATLARSESIQIVPDFEAKVFILILLMFYVVR
jgi:hypothetical protein